MQDTVGIAVVGCGFWGSKHIRIAHQSPQLEASLAVDFQQDRLDYIAKQYPGVPVAQEFETALESDAEGIIIATPISTHYKLAKMALLAGKNVLVEKPLATSPAECLELIELAEKVGKVLMVGHTFEYHPAVEKTREIIQNGGIGEIYYVNSRRLNLGLYQRDSNVLWDLAPHDLSIIFRVLETEVESADAWGCRHVLPTTEDVVYAQLGLTNGATAHIHVSWLDPVKVRNFTVVGSEGMLVFDDSQAVEKVKVFDKRFKPVAVGDNFADFQSAYHNGDTYVPELDQGEPLQLEVLDFANAIRTGQTPRASGRSGWRVVEALDRISKAMEKSRSTGFTHVFAGRNKDDSAQVAQSVIGH